MADSVRPSVESPTPLRSNASAPAVRLEHLHKRFGERVIVDDVDLHIAPGELVALLGESGSGKSTLLNLVAGLELADSGLIEIAGRRLDTLDDDGRAALRRDLIGFAFQAFHLLAHLDVQRNVAVPLMLRGEPARLALEQSAEMLGRLGLGARLGSPIRELSGGEQQRVALARSLVSKPALILADEPTGNLDPDNAKAALDLIATEARAGNTALLLVTHSREAAMCADRRLSLRNGRLQAA